MASVQEYDENGRSSAATFEIVGDDRAGSPVGAIAGAVVGGLPEATHSSTRGQAPVDLESRRARIDALESKIDVLLRQQSEGDEDSELRSAEGELATLQAFVETLMQGHPVTYGSDGQIIELSPDGTGRVVGHLPPQVSLSAGTKIKLR